MSAYTPPSVRERRPLSIQAFEFICLCVIFGSILFLAFAGAALIEPPVIPMIIDRADNLNVHRLHDGFELLGDEDTDYHDATEGRGALAWALGAIFLLFFCIGAWWL